MTRGFCRGLVLLALAAVSTLLAAREGALQVHRVADGVCDRLIVREQMILVRRDSLVTRAHSKTIDGETYNSTIYDVSNAQKWSVVKPNDGKWLLTPILPKEGVSLAISESDVVVFVQHDDRHEARVLTKDGSLGEVVNVKSVTRATPIPDVPNRVTYRSELAPQERRWLDLMTEGSITASHPGDIVEPDIKKGDMFNAWLNAGRKESPQKFHPSSKFLYKEEDKTLEFSKGIPTAGHGVSCIFQDSPNTSWIGLYEVAPVRVSFKGAAPERLKGDWPKTAGASLLREWGSKLLVGTFTHGLYELDPQAKTAVKIEGIPDSRVNDIEVVGNGAWIACDSGLFFLQEKRP